MEEENKKRGKRKTTMMEEGEKRKKRRKTHAFFPGKNSKLEKQSTLYLACDFRSSRMARTMSLM